MEKYPGRWLKLLVFLSLLVSSIVRANDTYDFPPEIQSQMFVEAENLLAELEDQLDMPAGQRLAQNGKFREALLAAGKDRAALVSTFTARMLNRYPEMLPGFLGYNALKFGVVIPTLMVAGYWTQAWALAAAPDTLPVIVSYASMRLPFDVFSNRARSGYWFYQIFQRRDELLGIRVDSPTDKWPYFSPLSKFQFFNMRIPIGVIDGEVQYDEVFLPVRRLGSLRLMEEMLLPAGLISESYPKDRGIDDELSERGWVDESTLTGMLASEMGEEELNEFLSSTSGLTSDARLRQMAMLEWILKSSFQLKEINKGLLTLAQTQLSPTARVLLTIEMARSEIQFHKKVLRKTSREERQQRKQEESWNIFNYAYNTTVDYIRGIPEQSSQGKIIRRLNQLELDIVAADLSGDPERIDGTLQQARAYLFAINLEHQVDTIPTSSGCEILLMSR